MTHLKSFNVTYDREADVLYISTPDQPAVRGVEDFDGILWRYDGQGKIIGVTVMDFDHHWHETLVLLANRLSEKLEIPSRQVFTVLNHAIRT
jgi:uncharacterized protein YuzE